MSDISLSPLLDYSKASRISGYSRYELHKLMDAGVLTEINHPGVRPKLLKSELDRLHQQQRKGAGIANLTPCPF